MQVTLHFGEDIKSNRRIIVCCKVHTKISAEPTCSKGHKRTATFEPAQNVETSRIYRILPFAFPPSLPSKLLWSRLLALQ